MALVHLIRAGCDVLMDVVWKTLNWRQLLQFSFAGDSVATGTVKLLDFVWVGLNLLVFLVCDEPSLLVFITASLCGYHTWWSIFLNRWDILLRALIWQTTISLLGQFMQWSSVELIDLLRILAHLLKLLLSFQLQFLRFLLFNQLIASLMLCQSIFVINSVLELSQLK